MRAHEALEGRLFWFQFNNQRANKPHRAGWNIIIIQLRENVKRARVVIEGYRRIHLDTFEAANYPGSYTSRAFLRRSIFILLE